MGNSPAELSDRDQCDVKMENKIVGGFPALKLDKTAYEMSSIRSPFYIS